MMTFCDRVYGKSNISNSIILELLSQPAMQRLKEVDQAGYIKAYFPQINFKRFEHSVGVYLLLKKFGASKEEQIAGLIHDISHSAFSHCVDYALKEGSGKTQAHQDNVFADFVRASEIPLILKKYDIDLNFILDDKNFSLKERLLPDLCADRIDYSLRTALVFKEIDQKTTTYFLNQLVVANNNWLFKNFLAAKRFARFFLKMNQVYFCGFQSAVMFKTVGDYLRHSLSRKYINKKDLYATDKEVITKINSNLISDKKLRLLWQRMNGKVKINNNIKNYDVKVYCKSRIVDPLFKTGSTVVRLSSYLTNWKPIIAKESSPKVYFLKFEN